VEKNSGYGMKEYLRWLTDEYTDLYSSVSITVFGFGPDEDI
jgi:hypothetical protein